MAAKSKSTVAETVTQQELTLLLALKEFYKSYSTLHENIRVRVLHGASVEPGEVSIKIVAKRERRVTQNTIRILFRDFADLIIEELPLTTRHLMFVRPQQFVGGPVFTPCLNVEDDDVEKHACNSIADLAEAITDSVANYVEFSLGK